MHILFHRVIKDFSKKIKTEQVFLIIRNGKYCFRIHQTIPSVSELSFKYDTTF